MNRYFTPLALSWICLSLSLASAQDDSISAPPSPPFMIAPTDASWTMQVTPATGTPPAPKGVMVLVKREAVQKGNVRREIDMWSDGSHTESWIADGVRLIGLSNGRGVHLLDPARDRLAAADISRMDFFAIDWLSPNTFVRKETCQGHPCFLFKKQVHDVNPGADHSPGELNDAEGIASIQNLPGQAWIDVTTKQMVAYNDGANLYVFTYGPPPPGDFALPPAYGVMIKRYKEDMNPLHVPLAPH